jgi:hypothetical protein
MTMNQNSYGIRGLFILQDFRLRSVMNAVIDNDLIAAGLTRVNTCMGIKNDNVPLFHK